MEQGGREELGAKLGGQGPWGGPCARVELEFPRAARSIGMGPTVKGQCRVRTGCRRREHGNGSPWGKQERPPRLRCAMGEVVGAPGRADSTVVKGERVGGVWEGLWGDSSLGPLGERGAESRGRRRTGPRAKSPLWTWGWSRATAVEATRLES